jgi:AP2 domain
MKSIDLSRGYVALVDDADYERVNKFTWCVMFDHNKDGSIKSVYAHRTLPRVHGKQKGQFMHRLILGVTDPAVEVDHEDHNGLNNQRYNMRRATKVENGCNRRVNADSASGFKGVSWHKATGKWQAQIQVNGQKISLSLFTDSVEAARAYDAAAITNFGEFACTNAMLGLLPPLVESTAA